jgi:uroporphyrinogen decarboxylase
MNSRERVVAAINRRQPDRVPIDTGGTLTTAMHQTVYDELKGKLGILGESSEILELALQTAIISEEVLRVFGGDLVGIYSKPPECWKMVIDEEDNSYLDEWGIKY